MVHSTRLVWLFASIAFLLSCPAGVEGKKKRKRGPSKRGPSVAMYVREMAQKAHADGIQNKSAVENALSESAMNTSLRTSAAFPSSSAVPPPPMQSSFLSSFHRSGQCSPGERLRQSSGPFIPFLILTEGEPEHFLYHAGYPVESVSSDDALTLSISLAPLPQRIRAARGSGLCSTHIRVSSLTARV